MGTRWITANGKLLALRLVLAVAFGAWLVVAWAGGGAPWTAFAVLVAAIGALGVVSVRSDRVRAGERVRLSGLPVAVQAALVAVLLGTTVAVDAMTATPSPTGFSPWVLSLPIAAFLFADVWLYPLQRLRR